MASSLYIADKRAQRVVEPLVLEGQNHGRSGVMADQLYPGEAAAFWWVLHGLVNKDIADRCCVSPETVKQYLHKAYRIFGFANRQEALYWWAQNIGLPT